MGIRLILDELAIYSKKMTSALQKRKKMSFRGVSRVQTLHVSTINYLEYTLSVLTDPVDLRWAKPYS